MDRREFLKTLGITAGTSFIGSKLTAQQTETADEFMSILVDTTKCLGCRMCEFACAEANDLPQPTDDYEAAFAEERSTSETQWTVVNRYQTSQGEIHVKKQCMHCNQPACAAGCLTNAMFKTKKGPVIWRERKCMGCRFCMISCPFDIPKFEYNSAVPKIHKCRMCWERLEEGALPACVENCPGGALYFGTRRELLELARSNIYQNPDKYVHYIYGEDEAGGTGVLYLSAVPFEQLGFRTDISKEAYPEYSKGFLYSVPIVLILWPAFLLAINQSKKQDNTSQEPDEWKN